MYYLAHVDLFKNKRMTFESNTKERLVELIRNATTPEKLKDDFVLSIQVYKVEYLEQLNLNDYPMQLPEGNQCAEGNQC